MNDELFKILETYNVQWWLDIGRAWNIMGILAGDKDRY